MADAFDGTIDIPCPECGETVTKSVADLQREPKFPCPTSGCGGAFDATDLVAGLEDLGNRLDDLGGDITLKF